MAKSDIFEKPILKTKVKSMNVKLTEMFFGYLVGPIGALLASGIFTQFLNNYWTNVLFKNEIANSATGSTVTAFLTLLPLLSAILIVAGNLVMGQLIEKTKTKAGKARPWILLSSIVLTDKPVWLYTGTPILLKVSLSTKLFITVASIPV